MSVSFERLMYYLAIKSEYDAVKQEVPQHIFRANECRMNLRNMFYNPSPTKCEIKSIFYILILSENLMNATRAIY